MRFVKTTKVTLGSVTTKGTYTNKFGRRTNHKRKATEPISFVGVDGEGMNVNGEHKYVLFGVGEQQIQNANGLEWEEIFAFLYAQYKPRTAFVGFFLGYDFTQIFKTLPEDKAWMLLTTEGIALRRHKIPGKPPHPVMCGKWYLDILGSKRLKIKPKLCDCEYATCECKNTKPWMYICDVGSYFQQSFLKVIDPQGWPEGSAVVSDEEYEIIKEGKERRSTAVLDESMGFYNRLENVVLSRVMLSLQAGFNGVGVFLPPSKWFGPGQAAQTWLKNAGVPTGEKIRSNVPLWFLEAARASYFGGWFEIFMHGIIPGTSHEYDINSAYPHVIRGLPCLLHGKYTRGSGPVPEGDKRLTLVYANVWSPGMPQVKRGQYVGSMLHRDSHGQILRPLATEGWYWWDELQAAIKAGMVAKITGRGKSRIQRWVSYEPCDCPPPMKDVEKLYLRRLEVGKASPHGKAAKLVYNSMYGKFAQSVGEPIFGNPVYASRITSGCRRQILDAISTHPMGLSHLAMVATDGVYFISEHDKLNTSEQLGDWEYATKERLTLFKPGVYWDDAVRIKISRGDSASFKARGFKASDFTASIARMDAEFEAWASTGKREWPSVSFTPSFSMVTALQALRRKDWSLAGSVKDETTAKPVVQNADPRIKRDGLRSENIDGRLIYRSAPHYGMGWNGATGQVEWIKSRPYEKRFGMEDPFSDESREEAGLTPDGAVSSVLSWILKGE